MVHNLFWLNQGKMRFTEQGLLSGNAVDKDGQAKAGMGTCAADVDADLDLDILVVNLQAQSDSFFRNQGDFFVDDTAVAGLGSVSRSYTPLGVAWCDFDNDGYYDLFQANGRVTAPDELPSQGDPFAEENLLLRGDAQGRFFCVRLLASDQPAIVRTSRAAAFGDLNNDGGVDVVVVNRDGPAEVLTNIVPARQNWLRLRVLDHYDRDAVGAQVLIRCGETIKRFDVNPHYSYLASNDPRVHVGLGDHHAVDAITVHWPDGTVQEFGAFDANQQVTLRPADVGKNATRPR